MAKGKGKEGQATPKKYSEMTDTEKVQYKKEAFIRLIKPRVDKFAKAGQAVKQCASANYISSQNQKSAVIAACQVVMDGIVSAYTGGGGVVGGFTLPED